MRGGSFIVSSDHVNRTGGADRYTSADEVRGDQTDLHRGMTGGYRGRNGDGDQSGNCGLCSCGQSTATASRAADTDGRPVRDATYDSGVVHAAMIGRSADCFGSVSRY